MLGSSRHRPRSCAHDGTHTVVGVAWGAPIAAVQVRIDDGPWKPTELIGPKPSNRGFTWRFWKYEWGTPAAGEHTVTSRALDTAGNLQPAPDDPFLVAKHTYWESQRPDHSPGQDRVTADQRGG